MANSKKALVFLANGTEEIEFSITVDVLRRAKIDVTVAGVSGVDCVKCSRGVKICPDVGIKDVLDKDFDAVIIPGGLTGAKNMAESQDVKKILKRQEEKKKLVAAICAGPTVLKAHGIYLGKKITSHQTSKSELTDVYKFENSRVECDENLITSIGPGSAFEFILAIVDQLGGKDKKQALITDLSLVL